MTHTMPIEELKNCYRETTPEELKAWMIEMYKKHDFMREGIEAYFNGVGWDKSILHAQQ